MGATICFVLFLSLTAVLNVFLLYLCQISSSMYFVCLVFIDCLEAYYVFLPLYQIIKKSHISKAYMDLLGALLDRRQNTRDRIRINYQIIATAKSLLCYPKSGLRFDPVKDIRESKKNIARLNQELARLDIEIKKLRNKY
jgi:hypothetical protein